MNGDIRSAGSGSSHARERSDAVALLTVYLVLLLLVPSNVRIAALGSLGRPALLWGLALLVVWSTWRLQARKEDLVRVWQPTRLAYAALVVIAFISFAGAVFRGQPPDQITTAITSLARLLSWGGPLLIAMDGLTTPAAVVTMVRRLGVAGGLLAAFGLLQFMSGQSLLGWITVIPGLEIHSSDLIIRGGFARASGTSTHPLEHATALSAAVPPALMLALYPGRAYGRTGHLIGAGLALLIALGSVAAVSRSAIIGFGVAVLALMPGLPSRVRGYVVITGAILAAVGAMAFRGLFHTLLSLFTFDSDPSTQSRTDALARVVDFAASSPIFGSGLGTFLPRYYILDNQWALMYVELGALGFLALLALFSSAWVSAFTASRRTLDPQIRFVGHVLMASVLTIAVLFAFFDGLSFPIAAGVSFVIFGLSAALRAVVTTGLDEPTLDQPYGATPPSKRATDT